MLTTPVTVDRKLSVYSSLDDTPPFVFNMGAAYLINRLFSTSIPKWHSLYAVTTVGFFRADSMAATKLAPT